MNKPTDGNNEILTQVHVQSKMMNDIISMMNNKVGDANLRREIGTQRNEYKAMSDQALSTLAQKGEVPHKTQKRSQIEGMADIYLATMINKSPSYIAQILMEDSLSSVISVTKSVNRYPQAEIAAKDQAESFVSTATDNINALKGFL